MAWGFPVAVNPARRAADSRVRPQGATQLVLDVRGDGKIPALAVVTWSVGVREWGIPGDDALSVIGGYNPGHAHCEPGIGQSLA
jgi:hypothetical protein